MKYQEKSLKIGFFFSQNVENNKIQKEIVVINLAPSLPPLAVLWQSLLSIAMETADSVLVRVIIPFQLLTTGRYK